MNKHNFTEHAQKRKQQRGITDLQVELIRHFGDDHYQKGGCSLSYISEKTITRLRSAIDGLSKVALVKGSSENIVTAMHMERRIHKTSYVT